MDLSNSTAFTRRQFMNRSLVLASAATTLPAFLNASAFGMRTAAEGMTSIPGVNEDRVLVVVQLSGGNDGLNTIIPFGEDAYYRARPTIGIRQNQAITLSESMGLGMHPALGGLKNLYDEGLATVIQGVGYPNPNRSHFMSMDIWHTADTDGTGDGWLGRFLDSQCCGYGKGESGTPEDSSATPNPGIAIGREAPLAMIGEQMKPISFETPDLFRWTGEDVHPALADPYHRIIAEGPQAAMHASGSNANFLTRTALDAQVSSDLIRKAVNTRPLVEYPRSQLGRELAMVASMIRAGLKTRVYYTSIGGFDTHAGQGGPQGNHARLLQTFGEAIAAFYRDLAMQENADRVLTMTFSEFGRRVGQNASGGTDHGTAAPMFLCGPMVRPGILGQHPSMRDLDSGDLKYNLDFRTVYAAILDEWLQADSTAILGERFRPAKIFRS